MAATQGIWVWRQLACTWSLNWVSEWSFKWVDRKANKVCLDTQHIKPLRKWASAAGNHNHSIAICMFHLRKRALTVASSVNVMFEDMHKWTKNLKNTMLHLYANVIHLNQWIHTWKFWIAAEFRYLCHSPLWLHRFILNILLRCGNVGVWWARYCVRWVRRMESEWICNQACDPWGLSYVIWMCIFSV